MVSFVRRVNRRCYLSHTNAPQFQGENDGASGFLHRREYNAAAHELIIGNAVLKQKAGAYQGRPVNVWSTSIIDCTPFVHATTRVRLLAFVRFRRALVLAQRMISQ